LLLALLEGRGTGLDVERALAGLARFSAEHPAGFDDLTGPWRACCGAPSSACSGVAPLFGYPEADLALAVLAWTRGSQMAGALDELRRKVDSGLSTQWGAVAVEATPGIFLSRRIFELVHQLAARTR